MKLVLSRSSLVGLAAILSGGVAWSCSSSPPGLGGPSGNAGSGGTGTAAQGNPGGVCYSNNSCNGSYTCIGGYCFDLGAAGASGSSAGGSTGLPTGSVGGACYPNMTCDGDNACTSGICLPTSATQGDLGGACYANQTCNTGLTCVSGVCLSLGNAGGASGAGGSGVSGSSPGGSSQGGNSQGGNSQGGSSQGGSSQGGTISAGGSAGSAGAPSTLIYATDGFVAPGTNSVGVTGPWFTYKDTYSTISPTDFSTSGSQICVQGTVSHSDVYGPTIGLNLNQTAAASSTPGAYIPSAHGVTGFSFDISYPTSLPSELQIGYHTLGDAAEYCVVRAPLATGNTVYFSSAYQDCYSASPGPAASTSGSYQSIQFQLPVNYYADGQSFNFCITNLRAILG